MKLSVKNMLLRFIGQKRLREEGEEQNKIRFGVLEDQYDHFWPCQIFIFTMRFFNFLFPSKTKTHLLRSLKVEKQA